MNICLINICIRGITDLKIRFERIRNLYLIVYKMFWRSGGRSPPNRAIWVLAVAGYIVLCSWAKHFILTVPLSTQVNKLVLVNLMLAGKPAMN